MVKEILIIKHIDIEGPGTIGEFLQNTSWCIRTLDLSKDRLSPQPLENIEAIISLGGPMNVYEEDKYPFLKEEDAFLKMALKEEVPILGICLGAQLLAKALGARVIKTSVPEIGWHKITLTADGEEDALFEGLSGELDVFQWHEDTFDIPAGAALLAASDSCQNQAFKWGKNAYGLQFHVEVTPEMVESWINTYVKKERAALSGVNNMLVQSYKSEGLLKGEADRIYLNFSRIINAYRKTGVT